MSVPVTVELLVDGVVIGFKPGIDRPHREQAEAAFDTFYANLAGTPLEAEVDGWDTVFTHAATTVVGIPVPVTKEQAEYIKHAKYEHGGEIAVLDVNNDGTELYVLSASGSRRILANVRARYAIAKRLGCTAVVENGGVCWRGNYDIK